MGAEETNKDSGFVKIWVASQMHMCIYETHLMFSYSAF